MTISCHPITTDIIIRPVCSWSELKLLNNWVADLKTKNGQKWLRKAWRKHQAGDYIYLLALANDYPIGRLVVSMRDRKGECDGKIQAELFALDVFPGLQGHGIATKLRETAEDLLRRKKFRRVVIGAYKENQLIQTIYREKWGFSEVVKEFFNSEEKKRVIFFGKNLNSSS